MDTSCLCLGGIGISRHFPKAEIAPKQEAQLQKYQMVQNSQWNNYKIAIKLFCLKDGLQLGFNITNWS